MAETARSALLHRLALVLALGLAAVLLTLGQGLASRSRQAGEKALLLSVLKPPSLELLSPLGQRVGDPAIYRYRDGRGLHYCAVQLVQGNSFSRLLILVLSPEGEIEGLRALEAGAPVQPDPRLELAISGLRARIAAVGRTAKP